MRTLLAMVTTMTQNGKPIPNVNLDCRYLQEKGLIELKTFNTDAQGQAVSHCFRSGSA